MLNDNKHQVQKNNPPILGEDSVLPPTITTPPQNKDQDIKNPSPTPTDSASSSPTDDIANIPPVVTGSIPKKKFAGGKVIATILGLFLLIGGLGAGVYLTQQNQNIEEKAECLPDPNITYYNCGDGVAQLTEEPNLRPGETQECWQGVCLVKDQYGGVIGEYRIVGSGGGGVDCRNERVDCPPNSTINLNKPKDTFCLTENGAILCGERNGIGTAQRQTGCCGNIRTDENGDEFCRNPEFTTYDCESADTASCQNVKAYDEDWMLLTSTQLSQLKTGDKLNFCVTGVTSNGSFDKAKFTINNVAQAETTTKRPNSNDYCQNYVIPTGGTTFNITAKIHHVTLGWK